MPVAVLCISHFLLNRSENNTIIYCFRWKLCISGTYHGFTSDVCIGSKHQFPWADFTQVVRKCAETAGCPVENQAGNQLQRVWCPAEISKVCMLLHKQINAHFSMEGCPERFGFESRYKQLLFCMTWM